MDEQSPPLPCADAGPEGTATLLRRLQREVEALNQANHIQEQQILENLAAMERMLREVEEQRNQARAANRSLASVHQLLSRVTEAMADPLIVLDGEGLIRSVNRMGCTLFGRTEDELRGTSPDTLLCDADLRELSAGLPPLPWPTRSILFEAICRRGELLYEVRLRTVDATPDALPVFQLHGSPMHGPSGKLEGAVLIGNEITLLKQREAALMQERARADAANRAKSDFLANMSHELRTPLNAIIGFSEAMLSGIFGPFASEQHGQYVHHIHKAGNHLLSIINDILDIAKIEANHTVLEEEVASIAGILEAALVMVGDRVQTCDVAITVENRLPSMHLRCDARRLTQVLVNLITNAVKFTHADGRVTVEVGWSTGRDALEFVIRDTGIGIAAADIPKVMEPFGQVEGAHARRHPGTGLGLPLARRLVELHGGELHLASTLGEGTTVTLRLPAERLLCVGCTSDESMPCTNRPSTVDDGTDGAG